ncbi:MAG TPA: DUF438 domain-containing protein [Bacillota bacterium]|nr:DUF438 domain-containing protein [Bacillota bacterium]HPZ22519.1 DUF438 domain-containing protein [Bacillota bacterium]HQD20347.1 DUF438 domain-containing protein [Bacillota bacterium]
MSEQINNREYRKETIKKILAELHAGKSVEEVKELFADAFDGVSAMEISEAEAALIAEGIPIEEVQKLCDVHAAVFKGSIEDIHQAADPSEIPGHPANVLKLENRFIKELLETRVKPNIAALPEEQAVEALKQALSDLAGIDLHYMRKENLFFPYLEKYGITAPPKVMWGVDDEIRQELKEAKSALFVDPADPRLKESLNNLTGKIIEMIYKEENILLPMLLDSLSEDEWKLIARESEELGYMLDEVPPWDPVYTPKDARKDEGMGGISLPSGNMDKEELAAVLNTLPFDITFVDKNDEVKYFSEGKERIFPRTRTIIGRKVANCHPPASVAVVEKIVADLRSGRKDHEDFWIKKGNSFILIRYFAVRNDSGEYLGVLEVTQDIKPLQEITGEKRLMS